MSEQVASASLDAAIASAASKGTYAGAGLTVSSWILSSEPGFLAGILIGLIGLVINVLFRWRDDRRRAIAHRAVMAEHSKRMALLDAGQGTRAGDWP